MVVMVDLVSWKERCESTAEGREETAGEVQ